jgi:hypothetical protein
MEQEKKRWMRRGEKSRLEGEAETHSCPKDHRGILQPKSSILVQTVSLHTHPAADDDADAIGRSCPSPVLRQGRQSTSGLENIVHGL